MKILYEDNHIIVVNKEQGEIVQGDKTGDKPLSEIIKEYIKEKYQKKGNVFLGVVHRVDRPVSGAVIFAKTSKALARLNDDFKNSKIEKFYHAICLNKPPQKYDKLENLMYKNEKQNKSYITKENKKDAKNAILEYYLIESSERYHLLDIKLHTGRHHQIRCQLANINCPIRGDKKYGYERANVNAGIDLHSYKIIFEHPIKKEKIEILAPYPEDKIWKIWNTINNNNNLK